MVTHFEDTVQVGQPLLHLGDLGSGSVLLATWGGETRGVGGRRLEVGGQKVLQRRWRGGPNGTIQAAWGKNLRQAAVGGWESTQGRDRR